MNGLDSISIVERALRKEIFNLECQLGEADGDDLVYLLDCIRVLEDFIRSL